MTIPISLSKRKTGEMLEDVGMLSTKLDIEFFGPEWGEPALGLKLIFNIGSPLRYVDPVDEKSWNRVYQAIIDEIEERRNGASIGITIYNDNICVELDQDFDGREENAVAEAIWGSPLCVDLYNNGVIYFNFIHDVMDRVGVEWNACTTFDSQCDPDHVYFPPREPT